MTYSLLAAGAVWGVPEATAQSVARSLTIGAVQAAQRNPAASPYKYVGWGAYVGVDIEWQNSHSAFDLRANLTRGKLRSTVSGGRADQSVLAGGTRYLRAAGTRWSTAWAFGADVAATADLTRHTLNSMLTSDERFGYFLVSLSPAIRVTRGRFANDFAVPAATWLASPYTNVKPEGTRFRAIVASPHSLFGFENVLSYRVGSGSHQVLVAYRASYLGYTDGEARRFARHSLSLTAGSLGRRASE